MDKALEKNYNTFMRSVVYLQSYEFSLGGEGVKTC